MEKKLKNVANWFTMDRLEVLAGVSALILITGFVVLGVTVAVTVNNYMLLALGVYAILEVIVEVFINKPHFKKLTASLVKNPLTTKLVFFILGVSSIILSWWFFVAFLLCIPQAIIYAEFSKAMKKNPIMTIKF